MPSRLQVVEAADAMVDQLAEAAGFAEDCRHDIRAAVHESLVNAIRHGNRGDEARRVTLELELDSGGLEIRVRDEGPGFDPNRLPDPLALENLCRSSGRGILLMRALMDSVTFRRARGGMEVTLRKRHARRADETADAPSHAGGNGR